VNKKLLYLLCIAFIIRMAFSTLPSFEYDESAYRSWSARLVELGPSHFYSSQVFTNNPLGGLYMFWSVGLMKNTVLSNLSFFSRNYDFLLKLPASIADIATGFIIYLLIKKVLGENQAILGYLMYVLNPALIFNSSIWGQYDGVSTFFLLLATYVMFIRKNPEIAAAIFTIAWIIKPQAIFFAPALILLIILTQNFKRWVTSAFASLISLIIIYLPFFPSNPILGLINVNKNSAGLFNCTTCFALNFWGIFGNWQNDLQKFIGIPFLAWGIILLLLALIPLLLLKPFTLKFKPQIFYFTSSISMLTFFMLLTRMHERYLFPFFPFLLIASLMLRSKVLLGFYIFMSGLHLLNLYIPYAYYNNLSKVTNLPVNNLMQNFNNLSLISFLGFIFLFIYFLYYVKQIKIS